MPVLEIHELKKSYRSPDGVSTPVIDVPSFSVEVGEQVALHGSSGSGKTTLLHLIAGILQPDAGEILIDGNAFSSASEATRDRLRARHVGYIFQTFNLLQGFTALQNVELAMMFGRGMNADLARHLLVTVGLADRLGYRPRQLSVGQQQRVAVARALANHPTLVLADEPTGNLDPHHAREALALIRRICQENGAALLLVSHDIEILSQFERVEHLASLNRAASSSIVAHSLTCPAPGCGRRHRAGDRFCSMCGSNLHKGRSPDAPVSDEGGPAT